MIEKVKKKKKERNLGIQECLRDILPLSPLSGSTDNNSIPRVEWRVRRVIPGSWGH